MCFFAGACARDPADDACPDVRAGELVVTEIRGDQAGTTDQLGQWIEMYNASARHLDLSGLTVLLRKIDGGSHARIIVRAPTLGVDAGHYVVLGGFASSLPAYVDYGYLLDFSSNLYTAAAIDVDACGTLVDRVVYRSLPTQGTWAFDGRRTPDATANDDERAWCVDAAGTGHPGTPRAGNAPCP
ncbi:MAG TPA: hypothetical protein VKE22_02460 [Haliangiales bacterium]|nr:hypothetical protein [Haliangiales bacterium]